MTSAPLQRVHCGPVAFDLYSDKEPGKPDRVVIEARVLQQIWQDFAVYRALP